MRRLLLWWRLGPGTSGRHPVRTALTVAGIAAGVALSVSIVSMNQTLLGAARATIAKAQVTATAEVDSRSPAGVGQSITNVIARTAGVQSAIPLLEEYTRLLGRRSRDNTLVLGATPDLLQLSPALASSVTLRGSLTASGVALTQPLAAALGTAVGHSITMQTPIGTRRFLVSAVISGPPVEDVNNGLWAVMTLPTAQQVFSASGLVSTVLVVPKASAGTQALLPLLERTIGSEAEIHLIGQPNQVASEELRPLSQITLLVGMLALFVSLMIVINTMAMAVGERRHELSLARAAGMVPSDVVRILLLKAGVDGFVGSVLGLAVSYELATLLIHIALRSFQNAIPISPVTAPTFTPGIVAIGLAIGMVVALGGAAVPAWRALAIPPIEALRPAATYEHTPGVSAVPRWTRGAPVVIGACLCVIGGSLTLASLPGSDHLVYRAGALLALLLGVVLLLPGAIRAGLSLSRPGLRACAGFTGRIAGDSLATNPRRSLFTVGTIVVTLAMVVALGSTLGSAQSRFGALAEDYISTPLEIQADSLTGYTPAQPLGSAVVAELQRVPGVRALLPEQHAFVAMANGAEDVAYAIPVAAALAMHDTSAVRDAELSPTPDSFLAGLSRGDIAVSQLAARQLHVSPGATLPIPTPTGLRKFRVAATYADLAPFGSLYIDQGTYAQIWQDTGISRLRVILEPGASTQRTMASLATVIEQRGIPATVFTRTQLIDQVRNTLANTFSFIRAAEIVALLIALFGVSNAALTALLDRRPELVLQRALGMSRSQMSTILFVEAMTIGALGWIGATAAGLVLWAPIARAAGSLLGTDLPYPVPTSTLLLTALGALAIVVLATAYPQRVARRLDLAQELRSE